MSTKTGPVREFLGRAQIRSGMIEITRPLTAPACHQAARSAAHRERAFRENVATLRFQQRATLSSQPVTEVTPQATNQ